MLSFLATVLAGLALASVVLFVILMTNTPGLAGRIASRLLGAVGLELVRLRAPRLVGEDAGFAVYAPGRVRHRIRRRRNGRVAFVSTNPRKAMTSLVVRVRVSPVWRFQAWVAARLVQLAAFVVGAGFELSVDVDTLKGNWRCKRCGDNEHQARDRACPGSPCPMVPVSPTGQLVERAAMFQGPADKAADPGPLLRCPPERKACKTDPLPDWSGSN